MSLRRNGRMKGSQKELTTLQESGWKGREVFMPQWWNIHWGSVRRLPCAFIGSLSQRTALSSTFLFSTRRLPFGTLISINTIINTEKNCKPSKSSWSSVEFLCKHNKVKGIFPAFKDVAFFLLPAHLKVSQCLFAWGNNEAFKLCTKNQKRHHKRETHYDGYEHLWRGTGSSNRTSKGQGQGQDRHLELKQGKPGPCPPPLSSKCALSLTLGVPCTTRALRKQSFAGSGVSYGDRHTEVPEIFLGSRISEVVKKQAVGLSSFNDT